MSFSPYELGSQAALEKLGMAAPSMGRAMSRYRVNVGLAKGVGTAAADLAKPATAVGGAITDLAKGAYKYIMGPYNPSATPGSVARGALTTAKNVAMHRGPTFLQGINNNPVVDHLL